MIAERITASGTHRAADAVWRIESARIVAMLTRMVHATYSLTLNPAEFDPWLEWAYRVKFIDKPVRAQDLIVRV